MRDHVLREQLDHAFLHCVVVSAQAPLALVAVVAADDGPRQGVDAGSPTARANIEVDHGPRPLLAVLKHERILERYRSGLPFDVYSRIIKTSAHGKLCALKKFVEKIWARGAGPAPMC